MPVGPGQPGTGRGRVKNCGSAPGGGGGRRAVVKARATPGNPASIIIIMNFYSPVSNIRCHSRRQQVTCFRPYPCKVTLTTISLPSNAKDTKLVIG